jgi:hypothetical protein
MLKGILHNLAAPYGGKGKSSNYKHNFSIMLTYIGNPFEWVATGLMSRGFHTSSPTFDNTSEIAFLIEGRPMTRTQVRSIHPAERSVAQWAVLIDWDLQRIRQYVIVDPLDPSGLLYLNFAEYLSQSKVCASNSLMLIVVARPGSSPPAPINTSLDSSSDQNSPPSIWEVVIGTKRSKWTRNSRISWLSFLNLRKQVKNLMTRSKTDAKMVSASTPEELTRILYVWVRQLAHYAEVKDPGTYVQYFIPLTKALERILINNGQMAVVQFLKISLFTLYSYIAGNPLKTTINLGIGIRLRNGLPRDWHPNLRKMVREDHMGVIRILASLCNCYRAMEAPHPAFDVTSIQAPHPVMEGPVWEEYKIFCKDIYPTLLRSLKCDTDFKYRSGFGHMARSAGANVTAPAIAGITLDARAWASQPENLVLQWFKLHSDKECVNSLAHIEREHHWMTDSGSIPNTDPKAITKRKTLQATMARMLVSSRGPFSSLPENVDPAPYFHTQNGEIPEGVPIPILGRLHAIDEPAGKVRVVAICDYWTQVAMKPVHMHLFDILKRIPNDGTFDQQGRTTEYFDKGYSPHWSFDLKAATDTIPLALYIECLAPLLRKKEESYEKGRERTQLWARILTERDFLLPDRSGFVRYGTGQPMGALSSWASMAIVHHSLVQFAHYRATGRRTWFQKYLVLGDDIDISCSLSVSNGYQEVCAAFRIVIGLLKSLSSEKNVFEFANQRFCPGGNISPISLKEELSSTQTWAMRLEYAKRVLTRFGGGSKDTAISLMRKASTVAQWAVLSGELSHLRPSALLQLTRFCLLNPFGSNDPKDFGIDVVLKWLALGTSNEDRSKLLTLSKSPSQLRQLQPLMVKALLTALLDLIEKNLKMVMPEFYVRAPAKVSPALLTDSERGPGSKNPDVANIRAIWAKQAIMGILCLPHEGMEHLNDRTRARWFGVLKGEISPDTSLKYTAHAVHSITYLLHCVNQTNLAVRKQSLELKALINKELRNLEANQAIDERTDLSSALSEYLTPFQTAIGLWIKVSNIPKPIVPDLSVGIGKWLGVDNDKDDPSKLRSPMLMSSPHILPSTKEIEETMRAPLEVFKEVLHVHLGYNVPDLPYLSIRRPGGWAKVLNHWLRTRSAAFLQAAVPTPPDGLVTVGDAVRGETQTALAGWHPKLPG